MRLLKHKSRSRRKTTPRRWTLLSRRTPRHAAYGPLPALPPDAMQQRPATPQPNLLPPVTHTYQGGLYGRADLNAVSGRVMASLRPAFHIDLKQPLFRDASTWEDFEEARLARLRRMQELTNPWADSHGVNLGHDQGPKTLVFATTLYERFSDGTGVLPAVKR